MTEGSGAQTFQRSGVAYDRFMGRYSSVLAAPLARFARIQADDRVLDLGCGTGAFTTEAVREVGAHNVAAVDPSPTFAGACRDRHPAVDVREGSAEDIPFGDAEFDVVAAQLVWPFVADTAAAAAEVLRVLRPGGVVVLSVWDYPAMQLLSLFDRAVRSLWDDPPDDDAARTIGGAGVIAGQLRATGFSDVDETTLEAMSSYRNADEVWDGFLAGVGPPGAYVAALSEADRHRLRSAVRTQLSHRTGPLTLRAVARAARGRRPLRAVT